MQTQHILHFILFPLFIQLNTYSQTLTAENHNPVISEKAVAENLEEIDMLPIGQDSIWDYSVYMPKELAYSAIIKSNDDTILFPEANCVLSFEDDINTDNPDHYLKASKTGVISYGFKFGQVEHLYNPPHIMMSYPTYKGMTTTDTIINNNDTTIIKTTADAAGALTTCYQTYTNTLRFNKHIEQIQLGSKIITESYYWYALGIYTEVLYVSKRINYISGNTSETRFFNFVYKDSQSIQADTTSELELIAYPIPTKSFLYLRTNGKKLENLKIQVTNLTGAQINPPYDWIDTNEIQINLESTSSGTYILKVFNQSKLIKTIKFLKR